MNARRLCWIVSAALAVSLPAAAEPSCEERSNAAADWYLKLAGEGDGWFSFPVPQSELPAARLPSGTPIVVTASEVAIGGREAAPAKAVKNGALPTLRAAIEEQWMLTEALHRAADSYETPSRELVIMADGATPAATMHAVLATLVQMKVERAHFVFRGRPSIPEPAASELTPSLAGADEQWEVRELNSKVFGRCPRALQAMDRIFEVSPRDRDEVIGGILREALVACGCAVDPAALRTWSWAFLGRHLNAPMATVEVELGRGKKVPALVVAPGASWESWAPAVLKLAAEGKPLRLELAKKKR